MRETLHAEIAAVALGMAIARRRPRPGLTHHSDRGIQYACEAYRQTLAASDILPSMSRKGGSLDNAPMEIFFHSMKVERARHRRYATRAEARRDLFAYTRRLHSELGYITPNKAELHGA